MNTKYCPTCNEYKNLSCFYKNSYTKSGLANECISCKRDRKSNIRSKYFEYMKDKSCIRCGENDLCCLQFHHREPKEKSFNIAMGISNRTKWPSILEEMEKCDILCANCHFKQTAIDFKWYSKI